MANSISAYLSPYIVGEAIEALAGTSALLANTNKDFSTATSAKGKYVSLSVPQVLVAEAVTPANTAPAPSGVSIGYRSIEISNEYKTSFPLTGKETQDYELSSAVAQQIRAAVQGMAKKVNDSLWAKYYQIPYYVGNSGTGFFASNANGLSDMDKVLTDNFCPTENRKFICGTKDYAALVNLTEVHYANQFGGEVARTGEVGDVRGFMVKRDQGVPTHAKGDGITGDPVASATAAGVATVTVTCDSGDALVLNQGDIITFGDGYNYSVQADVDLGNSEAGAVTLDRGLEAALGGTENPAFATNFDADSIVAIGGDLSGISVVGRMPEISPMGYQTMGEHMPIIDPVSGFPFLLSIYGQYKQVSMEVSALWGVSVTDSRKLCRGLTYSS